MVSEGPGFYRADLASADVAPASTGIEKENGVSQDQGWHGALGGGLSPPYTCPISVYSTSQPGPAQPGPSTPIHPGPSWLGPQTGPDFHRVFTELSSWLLLPACLAAAVAPPGLLHGIFRQWEEAPGTLPWSPNCVSTPTPPPHLAAKPSGPRPHPVFLSQLLAGQQKGHKPVTAGQCAMAGPSQPGPC